MKKHKVVFLSVCLFAAMVSAASEELKKGTEVWVRTTAVNWGQGTIDSKCTDGYIVLLGGENRCFEQDLVAIDVMPKKESVKAGTRLIAKWSDNNYYVATVQSIDGDNYNVLYEDATQYSVTLDNTRRILPARKDPRATPAVPAAVPAANKSAAPAAGSGAAPAMDLPGGSPSGVLAGILSEARNKYEWKFSLVGPVAAKELKFSDNAVALEFVPKDEKQVNGPTMLTFVITNKSGKPISIDWDKSSMTSLTGRVRPVVHGDLGSVNFDKPQAKTSLASGGRLSEAVTPKGCYVITHNKGHYDDQGKWVEAWDQISGYQLFCGEDFGKAEGYEQIKQTVVGKEFTFSLNLLVNGAPKKYDFRFRIDDIIKTRDNTPSPLDAIK